MLGTSKLIPCPSHRSMDKAGNPICFKCGKIGFARDCRKHPYKPRVYALGPMEDQIDLPEQMEETSKEQREMDNSDLEIKNLEDNHEQWVEDPYKLDIEELSP